MDSASITDARLRITRLVDALSPLTHGSTIVPVRASIGTASYGNADELLDAIGLADRRMYETKGSQRRQSVPTPTRLVAEA